MNDKGDARSEERMRRIIETANDAFIGLDAEGTITDWNRQAEVMFGWSRDAALGQPAAETIIPPQHREAHRQGLRRFLTTGEGPIFEQRLELSALHRDGHEFPIELTVWPIRIGAAWTFNAFVRDISTRKRAEELLREREERVVGILRQATVGIAEVDLTGRFVLVNDRYCEIAGRSRDELLRMRMQDVIHPSDLPGYLAQFEKAARTGEEFVIEKRHIRRDGSVVWVSDSVHAVRAADGTPQCAVAVSLDITDRKRAENVQARFAAIVESSEDAIVAKTLTGTILSWNAAAERLFGYTAAEMIGRNISVLIPPDRPNDLEHILEAIRRGERVQHYETDRVRKDGTRIQVSISVSPIRDRTGRIVGAAKIARDISLRKALEATREQLLVQEQIARTAAEAVNRTKDEFLATVSHELRSPLGAIALWTDLLRTGRLDAAQTTRALEGIELNTRLQTKLIEDLLDASRIISGKVSLETTDVDLAPLMAAAVETTRAAADAKGLDLVVDVGREEIPVLGDAARLRQVAANLLSNAIKFTPRGGCVSVGLERIGSNVELAVKDTGEGIAPEFLPHLFKRFSRASGGTVQRQRGLGLGLMIARHLVQLHGGSIDATSPGLGHGTTFVVKLPVAAIRTAQLEPVAEAVPPAQEIVSLQGIRVLIADDDRSAREALTAILTAHRAVVTAVDSAAAALETVGQAAADVLVSDIAMPEADGYELVRAIRQRESGSGQRLPAIALSAYATAADRAHAVTAGYDVHLAKPVEVGVLVAALRRLLGRDLSA